MSNILNIPDQEAFFKSAANFLQPVNDDSLTVICAGHFILMPDDTREKMVPSFALNNAAVGIFPLYTWELGCLLAKQIQTQKPGITKLSLLINDWQAVPNDPARSPELPNRYREAFYNSFTDLPPSYKTHFDACGFNLEKDMYHPKAGIFYIKETALRDRFARNHKNIGLSTCDGIRCGNDKEIIYSDAGSQVNVIGKDGRAQCAGEIAQMILDITHAAKSSGQVNFINLMPEGCKHPVNAGSAIALESLRHENTDKSVQIENVFFDAHGINDKELFYALSTPVQLHRYTL